MRVLFTVISLNIIVEKPITNNIETTVRIFLKNIDEKNI